MKVHCISIAFSEWVWKMWHSWVTVRLDILQFSFVFVCYHSKLIVFTCSEHQMCEDKLAKIAIRSQKVQTMKSTCVIKPFCLYFFWTKSVGTTQNAVIIFIFLFSVTMDADQSDRPQSTMARITNFFVGSNSNANKSLLKWKQSGERQEWRDKAVDTLVKKLKKKKNGVKDMEDVLRAKTENSICVTIPRSVDGRLQVNSRRNSHSSLARNCDMRWSQ